MRMTLEEKSIKQTLITVAIMYLCLKIKKEHSEQVWLSQLALGTNLYLYFFR